jgi:glycine/sarcosine N-methyltransferase
MDQTTRETAVSVTDAAQFYDALAPEYDTMTGFQIRFVQEKPFFRLLVEQYHIANALDAGCGTGFHSLLLAQLGVAMTAIDVSARMMREAERHAKDMGLSIETLTLDVAHLNGLFDARFDAVFSLGNTIAHFVREGELSAGIEGLASAVKPGGILFLQLLNYDRILTERQRIQSVKEADGKTFVRFYDFCADLLSFNILTINRSPSGIHHSIQSIPLKPVRSAEIVRLLQHFGMSGIKLYGGLTMEEYDPEHSKNLVVLARAGEIKPQVRNEEPGDASPLFTL